MTPLRSPHPRSPTRPGALPSSQSAPDTRVGVKVALGDVKHTPTASVGASIGWLLAGQR
ncbi:MAG: hypothetical protein ACYDDU_09905 [Dermatophilaceae bacterium]